MAPVRKTAFCQSVFGPVPASAAVTPVGTALPALVYASYSRAAHSVAFIRSMVFGMS